MGCCQTFQSDTPLDKVASQKTFLDDERSPNTPQKVAVQSQEGRRISQRNKEELSDELLVEETTTEIPTDVETVLSQGLREILPNLDSKAIQQIWLRCRANSPDCTVHEVLYFAQSKAPALKEARNPAGLLIKALPECFEGSLLPQHRDSQRQAEESRRREETRRQDEVRRLQEIDAEGERLLAGLAAQDRDHLHRRASFDIWNELGSFARNCPPAAFEQVVRVRMAKIVLEQQAELEALGMKGNL